MHGYLLHYGIKGQKWGVRRYQNEDGSLTNKGKKKYDLDSDGNFIKKKMSIKKKVAIGAGIVAGLMATSAVLIKMKNNQKGITQLKKAESIKNFARVQEILRNQRYSDFIRNTKIRNLM